MSHTMLYKAPGPHEIHGGKFDYTIVADEEVDATVAAGWFKSTDEAKAAADAAKAAAEAKSTKGAQPAKPAVDLSDLTGDSRKK